MNNLTVNQVMLLLDISRNTNTQSKVSTRKYDLRILRKKQLVYLVSEELTKPGKLLVEKIKQL